VPFDLGDTVRLTAECTDADGALTTAGTASITITLPDGSSVSPSVPVPSTTGAYVLDYVTDQPGRHSVRWSFSDPASAYTDVFDVREATPALIVSLADAKSHLNITSTRNDAEIRSWLEATTEIVEQYTGITARRTVTETHILPPSGARAFVLRRTPVVEITALTPLDGSQGVPVSSFAVDSDTGVVRPKGGGLVFGEFTATYTAGRSSIPASVAAAALIILQHLWQTQRGASRGPVPAGLDDAQMVAGIGYAVPNRALQLMEPHRLPPGVA
jgi:hypothetical protein